jgi:hypothetical protein
MQIGSKRAKYGLSHLPGKLSAAVGDVVATLIVMTLVALPSVTEAGEREHVLNAGFPAQMNETELLNVPFVELTSNANWACCPA